MSERLVIEQKNEPFQKYGQRELQGHSRKVRLAWGILPWRPAQLH